MKSGLDPMTPASLGPGPILTVNGGSSSLKLAVFVAETFDRRLKAGIALYCLPLYVPLCK